MSDPLATQLARIAPEVDVPAGRAVFEQRRSRPGPPRWLLPAAVVALVVAGVVGLLAVTGDDDSGDVPVSPVATSAPVTRTDTDVVVPLPPVGEPALHNTSLGLLWVIRHSDGTVSVLPGTVDRPPDDAVVPEMVGISMLQYVVQVSDDGNTLVAGPWTWDDHGRSTDADRATDLVGYEGEVRGAEVAVYFSDADRVDGDANPTDAGSSYPLDFVADALGQPMDLSVFPTLSSSGPAWRYFDGGLVVEDGVGRICDVDLSIPVSDFEGCDTGGTVIDTMVTSDRPDATVWFGPPILAFQDPLRGFTHVIPLGGVASRNDAVGQGVDNVLVTSVEVTCGGPDGSLMLARVGVNLAPGAAFSLAVIDGGTELGTGSVSGSGETSVAFPLTAAPGPTAELLVTAGADEFARLRLPESSGLDCLRPRRWLLRRTAHRSSGSCWGTR